MDRCVALDRELAQLDQLQAKLYVISLSLMDHMIIYIIYVYHDCVVLANSASTKDALTSLESIILTNPNLH